MDSDTERRIQKVKIELASLAPLGALVTAKTRATKRGHRFDIEIVYFGKKYRSVADFKHGEVARPAELARAAAERQRLDAANAARAVRAGARHAPAPAPAPAPVAHAEPAAAAGGASDEEEMGLSEASEIDDHDNLDDLGTLDDDGSYVSWQ
jgi:hypothetical protein